ncbi:hypothetical protein M3Y94_00345500 [Aphelenchoides besseyi]|nr:hypothetical protein M3Y94_00345500 [Aphelenchoides besseyi]KAI6235398.1 Protein-tyrosine phosphatase [Aphelenchoides besseyi]
MTMDVLIDEFVDNTSTDIQQFFHAHFNFRSIVNRFVEFNRQLELDKDRIRVHGQYYNNIHLGKRIFGPARKQVFTSTIMGGVERRFEIIDNQVNHIAFTHEAFDENLDKVRNQRVKCRDDSRVCLLNTDNGNDFIHANKIHGSPLFNSFILTQAPMKNTVIDFWRMVWDQNVSKVFVLFSFDNSTDEYFRFWPSDNANNEIRGSGLSVRLIQTSSKCAVPNFQHYLVNIVDNDMNTRKIEVFHGDMNNSDDLQTPLHLLRIARRSTTPVVVVDQLGISQSACLVASELCIMSLLKGPSYRHLVQRSVHYLRSFRSFAIETPMQYIFIHRVVREFTRPFVKLPRGFDDDYARWLNVRSQRLFLDEYNTTIPAYRLLCPRIDPDLLPQIRKKTRPSTRREIHSHVGELPLPLEKIGNGGVFVLPNKYPRGARY